MLPDVMKDIGIADLWDEKDAKKAQTAAYNALKATPWGPGDDGVKCTIKQATARRQPTRNKAKPRRQEDPADKPTPKKAKANTQP